MSNTHDEHDVAEGQYITMEVPVTNAILAAAQGLPNLSALMEVVNRTTHTASSEGTSAGDDDMPRLATSSEDSDGDDDDDAVPPVRGTPRSARLADTPSSRPGVGDNLVSGDTPREEAAPAGPQQRPPSHGRPQRGGPADIARVRPRRRADDGDSDAESVGSMPSLQTVSDSSEMEWIDESDSEEEESDDEDDAPSRQRNATTTPGTRPPALSEEWYDDESDEEDGPLDIRDTLGFGIAAPGNYAQVYPSAARMDISEAVRFFMNELDLVASTPHPHIAEKDERRARTIMNALESVPEELVHRYEKVRAGVDEETCEGCAICRDDFISNASDVSPETEALALFAALPEYLSPAKIVAFPCKGMHLFHAECIEPWLARKTTCPTCRFDVDPESLTLTFLRDIRVRSGDPLANKSWRPPKCKSFERWLEREERKSRGEADCSGDESDNESDDSEDLPPLLQVTAELTPHNPTGPSSPLPLTDAIQTSMLAALAPLQAGPLHGDSDDLYSADFPRPSASTLPLPSFLQFRRTTLQARRPSEDEVEDGFYDDLPPLIPAEGGPSRAMPYASASNGTVEEINEDGVDDEDDEWEDDEDEEDESDEDEDDDLPPLIGDAPAPAPPAARRAHFHAIHMPTIEETMMAFAEVLEESLAAAEFDDLISHAVSQPPPPPRPRNHNRNQQQQQQDPPPPWNVDDVD